MKDNINPSHYKQGFIEVIDMMERIWGKEALILHCEMCAFKYRMRAGHKSEDLEEELNKALWYEAKAKQLRTQTEDS